MAAGVEVECARLSHQLHPGFRGRLVAFAAVARMAAGDEVLPCREAPAGSRDDVVERELARSQDRAAVLAGIAIAQQDILPRECAALVRNAAILEQPDHRRQTHGDAGRMQEVSVLFFRHGDALEHEDQRATRGADVDWLIGSVQHEHGSKQGMAVPGAMRR